MPKRRIIKANDLTGLFIYQDPKRCTIFYDIITRKGYIITSSDVKTYTIYSAMLPLAIIVAFLIGSLFNLSTLSSFIIFLALFVLYEGAFRIMFFYKLPVAEKWKPVKKENIIMYLARGYSETRLLILIVMLILLSILMPLYANSEHFSGLNLYVVYGVTIVTFIGAIISIIALITKKKNNL